MAIDAIRGHRVSGLSWPQVQHHIDGGALAVLPIGAAAKQHGYHLPLNTDWLQAEWFAERLMELAHVLVWPTLGYGYYPAFVDFPGSCTLSEKTFEHLLSEIAGSILGANPSRLLIVNTGVSTSRTIDRIANREDWKDRIFVYHASRGSHLTATVQMVSEQRFGTHADELETSRMLAIAPGVVDLSLAEGSVVDKRFDFGLAPIISRSNPDHPNYSASGTYGDPKLASVAKGEALLAAQIKDLADLVAGITQPGDE